MCSVCCGTKVGLILEHQNERVAFVADTVAVRLLLLLLLLMYVGCCCCCCCWLLLLLMLCWQRHMVHVYICSSNTTVQLYMYRECLGIPSQCFFMPKKCPKMTSQPMPVSTVHVHVSTISCVAALANVTHDMSGPGRQPRTRSLLPAP